MDKDPKEEGKSLSMGTGGPPEDLALHVLHSLDQPICIIDADDRFLFGNKSYAAQYGVRPETVRGLPVKDLVGEEFYEKRLRLILQRARSDRFAEFRGWVDLPEAGRRFHEADIRIYSHPGLVNKQCLILQIRDITEREQLDQRRRKSLDFQEKLLGSVPAMVWICGKEGLPYFYNESWLNFTGTTLVEQVREGWLSMVHPDDRQMVQDRVQYSISNLDELRLDFRLRYLMGGYRWVRMVGTPLVGSEDRKLEFVSSTLEIDSIWKRQESLRQELEEAQYLREQALAQKTIADRANREKSAYLSLASHEIRTPMNPVIGFADLLASNPDLDSDSKEMAQMIVKAGKNLLKLLDEVLDFAKIEAGTLQLSPEPTDVHDLLVEIDNQYAFDAKSRGIELRVTDNIDTEDELFDDRLRLQQVLGTLVSNSIRFTHAGHVELLAETEQVRLNDDSLNMLRFTITDTGVGMSEEEVAKLFKPFARTDSEFSEKYSGTGLGLAIAQKLVDAMRGTVSVESTPGQGSKVELVIPFTPVPKKLQRSRTKQVVPHVDEIAEDEDAAKVMIVDDEQSSRQVNSSLMQFLGYKCDAVASGKELLEQLQSRNYNLILMDIMMPGLDGFETTRRIRNGDCGEVNREAFIIAVTGCVSEDDRQRGQKSGVNAYLNKPLTIHELKETIKDYDAISNSR